MATQADWLSVDVVNTHLSEAAQVVGRAAMDQFYEKAGWLLCQPNYLKLESPLEAIFLIWYRAVSSAEQENFADDDFALYCQHELVVGTESFRLDFAILPETAVIAKRVEVPSYILPKIAVEVDGHTFHEKTKEQVSYRNQRDRLLQQDGWTVFHFSWSELTTDPIRCVREVLEHATNAYAAFDQEYWKQRWERELARRQRENDGADS